MATKTLRYTLEQIEDIVFQGFDYRIPDDVMEKISNLAMQVGSPDYVKTPIFKKRDNPMKVEPVNTAPVKESGKKRKGNKNMEITNDEDWDSIRSFQPTKIETKTGTNAEFDLIRSYINKLTDKNYSELCNKIIGVIEKLQTETSEEILSGIGTNIFEIASSNRHYSKIYAELYSDLSIKFDFIKSKYEENFNKFTELFNNIEYVDSSENYDKFCENNKLNEKRRSLAAFYLNLMNYGVISKNEIVKITRNLLSKIYEYISIENKKNEVDELTETIVILYKNELYDDNCSELIDGLTIVQVIETIAHSKVKDYKSLTNKSLFKFMDLIDM
jgi:hypothetical protein